MRVTWHGTLSFGLVSVPVGLTVAQDRKGVSFNQLHRGCGERVRMPKSCPTHGALGMDDIVKGYEIEKGKYVEVEDSELENVRPDASKTIRIEGFVELDQVDPLLFDRTYYLHPDNEVRGRDGYVLLVRAMEKTGRAAIANFILWGRENLCLVRAHQGRLVMDLLFYAEDIRDPAPIDDLLSDVNVSDEAVDLAVQIVEGQSVPFVHGTYQSGYREQLREMLEAKARGAKPKRQRAKPAPKNVDGLLDALRASVKANAVKPTPAKGGTTVKRKRRVSA